MSLYNFVQALFRTQHAVVHVSAIMHILPGYRGTYIRGGGGGYVLSGHCNRQQISVKTEGVLIFGGVLIYRVFTVIDFLFILSGNANEA